MKINAHVIIEICIILFAYSKLTWNLIRAIREKNTGWIKMQLFLLSLVTLVVLGLYFLDTCYFK